MLNMDRILKLVITLLSIGSSNLYSQIVPEKLIYTVVFQDRAGNRQL